MEIDVFRETWTLTCKLHIKVTIFMKTWNDPTVITVILPQPVWLETPIEVQFLTKVLKVIFSKVWGSVWGLYSTIWRNSCGNFDENSIRTRLAWSQEPTNSKNHEFILYSSSFGGRRQRRQPVNENWDFQENMNSDLQHTGQSRDFYKKLNWNHSHSGNFALDGLP